MTSILIPPTFQLVREAALQHWLAKSNRSRPSGGNDDFSDSMECEWQARAETLSHRHVAFFCGIGEWACHITDVLTDPSNDAIAFVGSEEEQRWLARQYARLMMVLAELLSDFESALKFGGVGGSQRNQLGYRVNDVHGFVNEVIKHKAGALHLHDHHLPLAFDDSGISMCPLSICLGTGGLAKSNKSFDCIVMPKLEALLDIALDAYRNFDGLIKDETVFKAICAKYQSNELLSADTP